MKHKLHFPVALLKTEGKLIVAAAKAYPAVAARLPDQFVEDAETHLGNVGSDVVSQMIVRGKLGELTKEQEEALVTLKYYMAQARKTARLVFSGETVKLHDQFQVNQPKKNDLATTLQRADIILGSIKEVNNLAAFKASGWTDAETKAFDEARDAFGEPEDYQEKAKADSMAATQLTHSDAEDVYGRLLTIQNAANLEFPVLNAANVGARHEFRLGIFPPEGYGHAESAPAPAPATTTTTTPPGQ